MWALCGALGRLRGVWAGAGCGARSKACPAVAGCLHRGLVGGRAWRAGPRAVGDRLLNRLGARRRAVGARVPPLRPGSPAVHPLHLAHPPVGSGTRPLPAPSCVASPASSPGCLAPPPAPRLLGPCPAAPALRRRGHGGCFLLLPLAPRLPARCPAPGTLTGLFTSCTSPPSPGPPPSRPPTQLRRRDCAPRADGGAGAAPAAREPAGPRADARRGGQPECAAQVRCCWGWGGGWGVDR